MPSDDVTRLSPATRPVPRRPYRGDSAWSAARFTVSALVLLSPGLVEYALRLVEINAEAWARGA